MDLVSQANVSSAGHAGLERTPIHIAGLVGAQIWRRCEELIGFSRARTRAVRVTSADVPAWTVHLAWTSLDSSSRSTTAARR